MTGGDRGFRSDELAGAKGVDDAGPSTVEQAEVLGAARELEWLARVEDVRPSVDFADRVMSVVATEPLPAPVIAASAALGGGRLGALLVAFRDMWRVAFGSGRPYAVRAQALAIVLVVLVAAGSVGGLVMVGTWNALTPERSPEVSPVVSPSPLAPSTPEVTPSETPEPSASAEPSETPEPSAEPTVSTEPSETPGASKSGAGSTPRPTATPTPRPTQTPEPTKTPEATQTPEPSQTPEPTGTDDHGGGG